MSPRAACSPASRKRLMPCGRKKKRKMKATAACPVTEDLRALLGGSLADQQQVELTQHLDQCEHCQPKLEALATEGTNVSQLVQQARDSEPLATSAYWPAIRAVGQYAAYAPTITPESARHLRESNTHFLLPP